MIMVINCHPRALMMALIDNNTMREKEQLQELKASKNVLCCKPQ